MRIVTDQKEPHKLKKKKEKLTQQLISLSPSTPVPAADRNEEVICFVEKEHVQVISEIPEEYIKLLSYSNLRSWFVRSWCYKLLASKSAENLPLDYRYVLWEKNAELFKIVSKMPPNCFELYVEKSCDDEEKCKNSIEPHGETIYAQDNVSQILLDVPRSGLGFEEYVDIHDDMLVLEERSRLFNVLYALSMYFPTIGYCQGMSYICALVLTVIPSQEEAFAMMIQLMEQYDLKSLFAPGFPLLKQITFCFDYIMKKKNHALWEHLHHLGVSPNLYATKWILTLFCLQFPTNFVLRVWDLFLYKKWVAIYQIAMTLIFQHEEEILRCRTLDQVIEVLQNLPKTLDCAEMRQDIFECCANVLSDGDLRDAERQYKRIHVC